MIPENLNDPEFIELWEEFVLHRVELKKPMTDRAQKMQLKKLSRYPVRIAILTLEESIGGPWSNLYPDSVLNRQIKAQHDFNQNQSNPEPWKI